MRRLPCFAAVVLLIAGCGDQPKPPAPKPGPVPPPPTAAVPQPPVPNPPAVQPGGPVSITGGEGPAIISPNPSGATDVAPGVPTTQPPTSRPPTASTTPGFQPRPGQRTRFGAVAAPPPGYVADQKGGGPTPTTKYLGEFAIGAEAVNPPPADKTGKAPPRKPSIPKKTAPSVVGDR